MNGPQFGRSIRSFNVLVAGPADVSSLRGVIEEEIENWNRNHGRQHAIRLEPTRWEQDTFPSMRGDGQETINEQAVNSCAAVIAVFDQRLGSRTPRFEAGTVEEIETVRRAGGDALVYFRRVDPSTIVDSDQFQRLEEFRKRFHSEQGRYERFADETELRHLLRSHIPKLANVLSSSGIAEDPRDAFYQSVKRACIFLRVGDGASTSAGRRSLAAFVSNRGDAIAYDLDVEVLSGDGLSSLSGWKKPQLDGHSKQFRLEIPIDPLPMGDEPIREFAFQFRVNWRDFAGKHEASWRATFRGKGVEYWRGELDSTATIVPDGCKSLCL